MREELDKKVDHFRRELMDIMHAFDNRYHAVLDDEGWLLVRRAENKALGEAIARHKREFDLMAGEKVEPIAYEAVVTLTARGGLSD